MSILFRTFAIEKETLVTYKQTERMIKEFIEYITTIKGMSTNTALAYENDLRDFVRYIKTVDVNKRWSTITLQDIDGYVKAQVERGLKPATTNRRIAAIRSVYNYMKRQGLIDINPARYESCRKVETTVPNTIPADELYKAYQGSNGVIHIMIGLLMYTGIRIQEMLDITRQDIDTTTCRIRIHGKGMKQRIVITSRENMNDIQKYMMTRRMNERVFKEWGQREVRTSLFYMLKDITAAPQKSPHAIRHTFATEIAKQGQNVSTLSKMLGHQSIRTTQKYIDFANIDTTSAFTTYQNAMR